MMAIIHSLKCAVPFSFAVPLLSLAFTHCHSLSFCHSSLLVVIRCTTRCHSLSLDVTLVCLFINDQIFDPYLGFSNWINFDLKNINEPKWHVFFCSEVRSSTNKNLLTSIEDSFLDEAKIFIFSVAEVY